MIMDVHPDIPRLRLFFRLVAIGRNQLDDVRSHLELASSGGPFAEFLNLAECYFRRALAQGGCEGEQARQLQDWWLRLSESGVLHSPAPEGWLHSCITLSADLPQGVARVIVIEARVAAIQDCRSRTADPLTAYGRMLERLTALAPPERRISLPAFRPANEAGDEIAGGERDSEEHRAMTPTQAAQAYILAHPRTAGDGRGAASRQRLSWTKKTRRQFEAAARLLEKSYGERPLSLIRQADILKLDEHFSRIPPYHHKRADDAAKSLEQICVEAEARFSAARKRTARLGLSVGTTNRHFRFLRLLCEWMASRVPSMARLEWSPVMFRDVRDPRDHRAAFAPSDGRKLFTLPPWRGCRSEERRMHRGRLVVHDSGYWVLPIAWYTGMRREEICKLLADDLECQDDIWYINVRDTDAGRTKNSASRRLVPLASELIRLGLPEFVRARRDRGDDYLFPELVAPRTAMGDVFYKVWWRRLRDHVPAGTTLHSIRHMVADELKFAGVSEEERADLLGHRLQSDTAGRYSKATRLARMQAVVDAIPAVTFSLRAQPVRLPRSTSALRRIATRMAEAGIRQNNRP
jgi:integrase